MTSPAKNEPADLARELRDEYPAVDVTTVVFGREFAGVGCCVIPQDKVLEIIKALEGHADLVKALEELLVDPQSSLDEPDTDAEVIRKMRAIARTALSISTMGREELAVGS